MASRSANVAAGLTLLFHFLVVILLQGGVEVSAQLVTCQTSGDSPLTNDAVQCVNYLFAKGDAPCCQNNCAGPNACTNWCSIGTAATDICGTCGKCAPCLQAGNNLVSIIQRCQSNGLVGGYTQYGLVDPTLNVKLHQTSAPTNALTRATV